MKAIRVNQFGGPEVLKLEELPDPKPAQGQVLVRIKAAGVNPVEAYMRSGGYAGRNPQLPWTPGNDGAGVVEAVGPGVTKFKAGDRVYTAGTLSGSYAELALCDAARVHALSSKASFAQGAALGVPYATAWRSLFQRAQAKPGETLLVHGASGAVGTAGVQMGRAAGMTVIGTAGSERGRKLVLDQGAQHVLDHQSADYADKMAALTGGKGIDVILEMRADLNLGRDFELLAMGGRVVIIGSRGVTQVNGRDLMGKDAAALGMVLFNATEKDLREIHAGIQAGLENGTLKPVIGQEIPLKDAAKAHEAVMQPGAYGKIVLLP